LDAGNFVRTLQDRQGTQVGCPEEIAFAAGWNCANRLSEHAKTYGKSSYGRYLSDLLREQPA
jgi:glucose-1-phosphate thymidylyltransferase